MVVCDYRRERERGEREGERGEREEEGRERERGEREGGESRNVSACELISYKLV